MSWKRLGALSPKNASFLAGITWGREHERPFFKWRTKLCVILEAMPKSRSPEHSAKAIFAITLQTFRRPAQRLGSLRDADSRKAFQSSLREMTDRGLLRG